MLCHTQEPLVVVCPLYVNAGTDAHLERELETIRRDYDLQPDLEVYTPSS